MSKYEEPFKRDKITQNNLESLVAHSEVVTIHSAEKSIINSDEDEKEKGVIVIDRKRDEGNEGDGKDEDANTDIHIIKSVNLKPIKRGNSFGLSPDDINLKFARKFKFKTEIPGKKVQIPEGSRENDPFEDSESEESKANDINSTKMGLNGNDNKYSDESDLEEGNQYAYEIVSDNINPILYVRNAPTDCYYLILRGKVDIIF
jgi:hypothetical protein